MHTSCLKNICCLFTFFFISTGFLGASLEAKGIDWYTNYDEGFQQARNSAKPVLILFTGSDWCTWCIKLEQEVLDKPEFADAVGDKFVFIKLDFPINKPLPSDQTARNKTVQKQYGVQGYPMIVILDGKQQKVGVVGYRPGGAQAYAEYLMGMLGRHLSYEHKIQTLHSQPMSGVELKGLYEEATALGRNNDAWEVVSTGVTSDQDHFFKLEKYRLLAEQGRHQELEAVQLRNHLLASDPNNLGLTHYQVALIDFEAKNKSAPSQHLTADDLIEYTEKFGDQDKDHLWKIQMIIAQVYFDQDNLREALRYARSSYQTAPQAARGEIASAIKQMQALIQ